METKQLRCMFLPGENEKEWLAKIAAGDEDAFADLFHHYRNRIYNIAYRFTENESIAEDIVQEIFLKIWTRRQTLTSVEHFTAYLFTITRNHIVKYIKQMARLHITGFDLQAASYIDDSGAEKTFLEKEYSAILKQAIEKLSPQQAQVYKLSKEEGMKREQIAALLNISPETVKVHLAHAMRNIRAYCLARLDVFILLWLTREIMQEVF